VSAKLQTISTLIVPAGTIVGSEKTLTFKQKEDFALSMGYKRAVSP
jgi:hypoxia up-regulated 1